MQLEDPFRHLIRRADQGKAAMTQGEQMLDLRQKIMRKAVGMGELQTHQIVYRLGIGVLHGGIVGIGLGLGFGRAADDVAESQHVHRTPLGGGLRLQLGNLDLGPIQINRRGEQEIRVVGGKLAPLRAAGGIDDRHCPAHRLGVALDLGGLEIGAVPVEMLV